MRGRRRGRGGEYVFNALMLTSLGLVLASTVGIVVVVLIRGGAALDLEMIIRTPTGGYYMGGGGGILNAIVGSLLLAFFATAFAFVISIAVATALQPEFSRRRFANAVRVVLELLWGVPSIVYGVICFVIMVFIGIGTSLLAGVIALTLLEIPIMTRVMDEALVTVEDELKASAYTLGSDKVQMAVGVAWRQAVPGLLSAVLLAFGRGIGDAASILFTAGFTDYIPRSPLDSVAALPTMIFFLATSPLPEVRARAYAAAFLLLVIVLVLSLAARLLSGRLAKYVVK